jgi:GAF domain-containing protein
MKSNDPKYGAPSFISMPIYKNKQVIAVINLANKENGGLFTDTDERILSIMLGEIGFALENVILRQEIKTRLAEIKELNAKLKQ